jgi:integrase/recombinase XerC
MSPRRGYGVRKSDFLYTCRAYGAQAKHSRLMLTDDARDRQKDPLAEEFLRYLTVERSASPRTLKAYRQALEAFRNESQTPWKKCTADNFRDYLFALMKREQARTYVRLQFSALRTFFRFLVERKKLRFDPVRELQLPKIEKKLPLVLTRSQIDELLSAPLKIEKNRAAPGWMPLRDVAIMELFYSSGLRLSELAALDVADVDLYTESVRVLGKGRKERECPIGLPALEAIHWKQFSVIGPQQTSIPGRCSSTNHANGSQRAQSGSS